jgi:hemolysin activation/secretion protein
LAGNFSLLASFNGQWASKNLDSSEKMILGGPNAIRAYSGSEAQGDSGWYGSLELRYDWPGGSPLGALQLQGYLDAGQVRLHQDTQGLPIATATGRNSYGLAGAGLGVSLTKPGSYMLRAGVAQAIGSNPGRSVQGFNADGGTGRMRGWVQALWWF